MTAIGSQNQRSTRYGTGFTLLELVLVLAIVGVLSAVAAPRFASSSAHYRADAAAWRIRMDLALARDLARTTGSTHSVGFAVAADTYTLPGAADPDRPASIYTVDLAADPYGAQLISADFGGASQVSFDGFGSPAAGGTVVIQAGHVQKTVTLDSSTAEATVE